MKKKLALLLSAVMVMGSIPMTAFADTTNEMSNRVTAVDGAILNNNPTVADGEIEAPTLIMRDKNLRDETKATFTLSLTNAEWKNLDSDDVEVRGYNVSAGETILVQGASATVKGLDLKKYIGVGTDKTADIATISPDLEVVKYTTDSKNCPKGEEVTFRVAGITYTLFADKNDLTGGTLYAAVMDGTTIKELYETKDNGATDLTDTYEGGNTGFKADVIVSQISKTEVSIQVTTTGGTIDQIRVPMNTELKGEGNATVSIDPESSVISRTEHIFATIAEGDTNMTISKLTDIQEAGSAIESIVIKETAAGVLKTGKFQLKLNNGFEWDTSVLEAEKYDKDSKTGKASYSVIPSNSEVKVNSVDIDGDKQVLIVDITVTGKTSTAATISLQGLKVQWDSDDVKAGDIASVTISNVSKSSAGVSKQTVDVGTAREHSVTWTAENKTVPTFYSGKADPDQSTLKLTLEEVVPGAWLESRKTTITLPEGVKILEENGTDLKPVVKSGSSTIKNVTAIVDHKNEYSVVELKFSRNNNDSKIKLEFEFELSIAPDFTGDIVATLGGTAITEDIDLVIGNAVFPFEVEADTNEVQIDYRNVSVGDIVIKEVETGLLEKSKALQVEVEYLNFDGTPTVEVVEGDIKLGKISTSGSVLTINVDTETAKTPAVLKVTDIEMYLERSIPAGQYAIKLLGSTFIQNNIGSDISNADGSKTAKGYPTFDVNKVTVKKDYIDVITGGRDVGETFTTTITVTIGASTMMAGTREIPLDVPAYISGGYTMLPVRAVIEALSDAAIVRWDDPSHSITITFGSRVVSMTVGSSTMNINGVDVAMTKACEITDSRSFIPLRDLGYALGLGDDKINWDEATKTATLN